MGRERRARWRLAGGLQVEQEEKFYILDSGCMILDFLPISDISYLKLDDALPETTRTIHTTRANLACFTSDTVSKQNVCPQGTCETWR